MLRRAGRPLALAKLVLEEGAALLDLDDPKVLVRERLRPSQVATRVRAITQQQAARLYGAHADLAALRWWSSIESTLGNLTIFDRAARRLTMQECRPLSLADPEVQEGAELLGLS